MRRNIDINGLVVVWFSLDIDSWSQDLTWKIGAPEKQFTISLMLKQNAWHFSCPFILKDEKGKDSGGDRGADRGRVL